MNTENKTNDEKKTENGKKIKLFYLPHVYIAVCTVLFIIGFTALVHINGVSDWRITVLTAVLYILVTFGGSFIVKRFYGSNIGKEGGEVHNDVFRAFISKYHEAVAVINDESRIDWANRTFVSEFCPSTDVVGKKLSDIAEPLKLADIYSAGRDGMYVDIDGSNYNVHCFKTSADGQTKFVVTFDSSDELNAVRADYEDKRTVIAYIILDNLDASVVSLHDVTRTVSARAQEIMYEWASEYGAFIREYESDKYIAVLDGKSYSALVKDGFKILDKIRSIKIPESDITVTASGGVSDIVGTMEEKASAASSALETALQRGGDQIVVKTDDKVLYFGGNTKSAVNASRVRARMYALMLEKMIKNAENVIVMAHRAIDYDGFGACVGIAKIAMHLGVKVNIAVNLPQSADDSAMNDKNLRVCLEEIRKLPEYDNVFVDKIEAQDLTTPSTLVIVTDVNNPSLLEVPALPDCTENLVFIDHHRKAPENKYEAKLMYISPAASSACEMVAEILEELLPQGIMQKPEANLMLAGITLDTKQFSRSCSVRTYGAAQYLRRQGADQGDVAKFFEVNQEEFSAELKFRRDTKLYKGMFAIAVKKGESVFDDKITAAKVADGLLDITGINASFALCKINGAVNISARSTGKINVSKMMEKFGGGGHFDSAGAQLNGENLENAVTLLKEVLDEYLAENKESE